VATHVKILGALHIVFGSLGLLIALLAFGFLGGIARVVATEAAANDPEAAIAAPIVGLIGLVVGILLALLSAPAIIAGIGLLQFKPWGRILGIVLSAINLLNLPLGTALGIYGLWTLLNRETELLFQSPPQPAGAYPG
jgi:hypothetical protein